MTGRIGAGVSYVRDKLGQELTSYGYEPVVVDVSRVILEKLYERLELPPFDAGSSPVARVRMLQKRGNELRACIGNEAIALLAVTEIIQQWFEDGDRWTTRVAFIIDSLKHPAEIHFLREVFGPAFYAIGVVASDGVRKDRLKSRKHYSDSDFDELSQIDAEEAGEDDSGQRAIKTIVSADYFVANDFSTKAELANETQRFLRLVFGIGVETPRTDEFGMSSASTAALSSGCLSRQVGASIVTQAGDILATGRNDVPKPHGGLYSSDSPVDRRCWTKAASCYNDRQKDLLVEDLLTPLVAELSLDESDAQTVRTTLRKSPKIRSLIEFSRAVHAEMDALLTVARCARPGLVGSTLFCTTYPCHSCARHLVAAGVSRVVYLEPYEKSLARTLHHDAIADPLHERTSDKVPFDVYCGVAPRAYDSLFRMHTPRKDSDGCMFDRDRERTTLLPLAAISVDQLRASVLKVVETVLAES